MACRLCVCLAKNADIAGGIIYLSKLTLSGSCLADRVFIPASVPFRMEETCLKCGKSVNGPPGPFCDPDKHETSGDPKKR